MKTLMILIATLATSVAFAGKDDFKIKQAEDLFESMTAAEALSSKKFATRAWNRQLPGTSTWMSPGNICINGGNIETVKPMTICTEWRVDLKEMRFGKKYKSFEYRGQASRYADDSSNARGSEYCADSYQSKYSHPIQWKVNGCLLWAVKREGSSQPKTFKSEAAADNYADESSKAKGQPYCVEEGIVVKSFNTIFKVDFYAKNVGGDKFDDDNYLGTYNYTYQSCSQKDLTPVPAN